MPITSLIEVIISRQQLFFETASEWRRIFDGRRDNSEIVSFFYIKKPPAFRVYDLIEKPLRQRAAEKQHPSSFKNPIREERNEKAKNG